MKTFDIINPATSAVLDSAPDASVDEAKQAVEQSVAAFATWKATTAFERSAILRKRYELIVADDRDAGADDDAGDGQAHHRVAGRGEVRRGVRRVVRRRSQARLRRHRPDARREQALARHAPAGRPGLRGDAVEFSGGDGDAQGRAGARRRMHGGAEAGGAVAADRDSSRRVVGQGRRPGRTSSRS